MLRARLNGHTKAAHHEQIDQQIEIPCDRVTTDAESRCDARGIQLLPLPMPSAPIDDPAQHREQIRDAMDLVEDHEAPFLGAASEEAPDRKPLEGRLCAGMEGPLKHPCNHVMSWQICRDANRGPH